MSLLSQALFVTTCLLSQFAFAADAAKHALWIETRVRNVTVRFSLELSATPPLKKKNIREWSAPFWDWEARKDTPLGYLSSGFLALLQNNKKRQQDITWLRQQHPNPSLLKTFKRKKKAAKKNCMGAWGGTE